VISTVRSVAAAGRFRRDLYYRLNVLRLHLPKLADRGGDIAQLAQHFLDAALRGREPGFNEPALRALRAHAWPGNVRELRNLIERLAVFAEGTNGPIDLALLRRCAPELFGAARKPPPAAESAPARRTRRRDGVEKSELRRALDRAGGDRQLAAQLLGVSRTTLWRWLAAAGL
jgi:transcriptional regulator, propionate catabolism operon regulatory protein